MKNKSSDKFSMLERFNICIAAEKIKYLDKGNGKWVSLLIFSLYFTLLPYCFGLVWPYFRTKMSDKFLMGFSIIFVNVAVLLLYNIIMYFIYTLKIPFFEQYRINPNLKWPWESDI
jgi:hypothetical protein